MKFALIFFALSLLLLGCHRQNATVHNNLTGTWLFETNYSDGRKFESTTTIGSNGTYFCHINSLGRSNIFKEFDLEGTLQIQDGFLIDTMTKHSGQTNVNLHSVTREQIIRFSDHELVVKFEEYANQNPENWREAVFRKAKN